MKKLLQTFHLLLLFEGRATMDSAGGNVHHPHWSEHKFQQEYGNKVHE